MSQRKRILWMAMILLLCLGGLLLFLGSRHGKIEEWSGALTVGKIAWAEASQGYGVDKVSYSVSPLEYPQLVQVLQSVTEEASRRKAPKNDDRIDYRLALHTDGKLWLFHCRDSGMVDLMFSDPATGDYFGCEGKLLYIDSPELWSYIVNTVDEKAA